VLQRLTAADYVVLRGAALPRLRVDRVRGRGWHAANLSAPGADFSEMTVDVAELPGADLSGSTWRGCSLPGADLVEAILNDAKITRTSLREARLAHAHGENLHLVECDLAQADMTGFLGRCLVARDVDMAGAVLREANLYRAMITGDPPRGMSLRDADLENSTLVQAYVAADLRGARLVGANCAYSRFSQSDLSEACLDGAAMYQSTWVKVAMHGTKVAGIRAPIFVDRCPGLLTGLKEAGTDEATAFVDYLDSLAAALSLGRKGST
jgi:uncharacterized protein YjbI with pentapeptide repeats